MQNHFKLLPLAVVVTSMLLSAPIFADEAKDQYKDMPPAAPDCVKLRDGYYVGIQGGYDNYAVRESTALAPTLASSMTLNANPVVGAGSWVGGLFLGFGEYFSNFYYLGGEIFVNDSGARENHEFITSDGSIYTNKYSVSLTYGISLLPGIKLNNSTLLYLRLGYDHTSMSGQEISAPSDSMGIYDTKAQWEGGFNYGLGLETYLSKKISMRTEYTHIRYGSYSNVYTNYNPSNNQFMLGFVYHFE